MNTFDFVSRLPNDIDGFETGPVLRRAQYRTLGEALSCTGQRLDFKKLVNIEEKRKGVEAFDETLIGQLPYYERWIVTFANISFTRPLFTLTELAKKMAEVQTRFVEIEAAWWGRRKRPAPTLIEEEIFYPAFRGKTDVDLVALRDQMLAQGRIDGASEVRRSAAGAAHRRASDHRLGLCTYWGSRDRLSASALS